MHRLPVTPGGWTPDTEGVIFVEQTPAPIVFLTAADTDIQLLAKASARLPENFPALRVANLLQLQQQLTIDTYAEDVLEQAQVIVLRILGGRAYWSYGLEVVKQTVEQTEAALLVLPGDDRPDPDLLSHSTVPLAIANQFWRYFTEGGIDNATAALQLLADACLGTTFNPPSPLTIPRVGLYEEWVGNSATPTAPVSQSSIEGIAPVGLLFYRAHYLAGNTGPIDALCRALVDRNLQPVPIFVSSLRDPEVQSELIERFQPKDSSPIQVLLNTTSFALARLETELPDLRFWQMLDVPVIQVILSGGTREQWESQTRGLSPRDIAMNVALPEVDGRIIGRAVSFKATQSRHPALETDVVGYEAVDDRIHFTADLAANWVRLRQIKAGDRRIALILANYPTRDGRLANGVGLDTPASCVEILKALQTGGYTVEEIPESSEALIERLTTGVTNDAEGRSLRPIQQSLALQEYQHYFQTLPEAVQQGVGTLFEIPARGRWQNFPVTADFPIPGIQLGNVFVGIQPARGYDLDPALNYHAPDLEPTHEYLAFYYWLRHHFKAHAIIHVGKHGNLEWLPGKGVALSETCYPEVALGALPHLYPFIVNDPGEGSQAKRRSQAVILDHLTPPLTRAELYGPLQALEGLIDEYYEAQSLDPTRLPVICDRIQSLVVQENLQQEVGGEIANLSHFLSQADTYLCELKEAQIRDGLHIFGQCPQGRQLRDLVVAIARHPVPGRLGITRAIAEDWNLSFDPLTANPGEPLVDERPELVGCRTVGDAIERLEEVAARLVEGLISVLGRSPLTPLNKGGTEAEAALPVEDFLLGTGSEVPLFKDVRRALSRAGDLGGSQLLAEELTWIRDRLLPSLLATPQEITHLLNGLEGRYIPSGASGAPTRGRPEVLPTGRNFYSVDIRAIPTETAWDVGRKAAEALVERFIQENGEYPQTLGLSIWGTSTMRTGGDDLAEALALIGVRPVWDGAARRVVDFEILPLSALGRPRVDVTLRISGFFRDAFPNLIDLFHQAVAAVAALAEPEEQNPLAARVRRETNEWEQAGLTAEQAKGRSLYRIFGSKPGAYGAGLQGLIEAQNWTTDEDLARAYINWSSYAYTGQGEGRSAPEAFEQRLRTLQIVLHNQDNREHDLLDSDDYYQFQGGMTVAVRSLTGQNPQTYFGDHAIPENPRVRTLKEEITRVYRSRVINPKWIAGVMRHGYKGAFEMSATVDYLFAYDATTRCVADYMYEGVAQAYLLDPQVQDFVQSKNPWALRDMAERLLEANQRGMWENANEAVLEELRAIANQAEGAIESGLQASNSSR